MNMPQPNSSQAITEVLDDIRNVVYGAWPHRWKIIIVSWLLCIPGWYFVLSLADTYQASSKMYVDTESSLRPLLQGLTVNPDTLGEATIMVGSIMSAPSLEQVAAGAGMTIGNESKSQIQGMVGQLRRDLIVVLDKKQVLSITYVNTVPDVALAVVGQMTDAFVEGLQQINRIDSASAQQFLEEKLLEYEVLLNAAEQRLANFKKENLGQMPGTGGGYFSRLAQEQAQLDTVTYQLELARKRAAALTAQMEGETPVFGIATPTVTDYNAGTGSVTDRQILSFEQELATLRIQYTDSHPDIVRLLSILDDLRAQKIEEQSAFSGGEFQSGALEENPVYQNMRMQLNAAVVEAKTLEAQRAISLKTVQDLRAKVDIIPDIEAKLKKLDRDYNVNKTQYEALLSRLESAKMTEAAEKSDTNVEFRIIDPPTVTTQPVGPNRPVLISLVMILAIGAGSTLALGLSFTRPVFFSIRSLEQRFGVPVLGGIRKVYTEADLAFRRKSLMIYVGCFVAIFGAYGLVISLNRVAADLIGGISSATGN
jgi:polysaccharide chain length determinant protein (PEP-CTERM system associated)